MTPLQSKSRLKVSKGLLYFGQCQFLSNNSYYNTHDDITGKGKQNYGILTPEKTCKTLHLCLLKTVNVSTTTKKSRTNAFFTQVTSPHLKICFKRHIKLTTTSIFGAQFGGIKYFHVSVQPAPPFVPTTLFIS